MPQVAQPCRRLPVEHLTPVVLLAIGSVLDDPPTRAWLERNRRGVAADRVGRRQPSGASAGAPREGVRRWAPHLELDDEGTIHDLLTPAAASCSRLRGGSGSLLRPIPGRSTP